MSGQRKAPNPRRHESELRLVITCPVCGLFLGRCTDEPTRERALLSHSARCAGVPL